MLRIPGRESSSNVQKAVWLLGDLGVEHVREDYGGKYGRLKTPDYLALNPNAVVPTLIDGDLILWESNSICRYLANKFQATSLYPPSPGDRALCERWMDWQLSTLSPALAPLYIARVRPGETGADLPDMERLYGRGRATLAILDEALATRLFVQGERLTLADICTGIWTHRWFALAGSDTSLPYLRAWYSRLRERPAYRRSVVEVALE